MQYLKVKNWEEFQHYKDRCPPWIKLHRDLLNDYNFVCLQDASKLHLMLIWLLASQMDNKIPADPDFIKQRLSIKGKINLKELIDKGFLIDDSGVLAGCKQVAVLETETEAYSKETEAETDGGELKIAFDDYNDIAEQFGLPKAQRLTATRKTKLKSRLKDCGGLNGWREAMNKLCESNFCIGHNDNGWKADFDFVLQEKSFTKLLEGSYDNREPKGKTNDKQKLAQGANEMLEEIRSRESS